MTLKLIDKDLRSKYAEALYKNEASYDKEIERRMQRLSLEYFRSTANMDAVSQIFLNKVRQKRTKWSQDDMRFREHYRLICRNVHNKKIENLKQIFDPETKPHQLKKLDPVLQSKFKMLQTHLNSDESRVFQIFDTEIQSTSNLESLDNQKLEDKMQSNIPKLPEINQNRFNNDDQDLYLKYSKSDREFLEKFPAKIELTVTDVGKQYLNNEKQRKTKLKRQKLRYARIQENAVKDSRYKNLENYLKK
ncbi:unnamed protein product [Brachionus calyciflorus]|uniref:Uncharacterized protein n=1 Tax=Brachionus calyciflorus TaxID=104777 RepID=A0A813NH44_9BILA|nr:unnamed protein product [Brachionus calyciflorus]